MVKKFGGRLWCWKNMKESFKYKTENAETYKALEIKGTTFEPSFAEAERMFGDLSGKTVLDFGSGAGRSSRFLKELGAKLVIGAEHNEAMINQAKTNRPTGVEYYLINKQIPLSNSYVDCA